MPDCTPAVKKTRGEHAGETGHGERRRHAAHRGAVHRNAGGNDRDGVGGASDRCLESHPLRAKSLLRGAILEKQKQFRRVAFGGRQADEHVAVGPATTTDDRFKRRPVDLACGDESPRLDQARARRLVEHVGDPSSRNLAWVNTHEGRGLGIHLGEAEGPRIDVRQAIECV